MKYTERFTEKAYFIDEFGKMLDIPKGLTQNEAFSAMVLIAEKYLRSKGAARRYGIIAVDFSLHYHQLTEFKFEKRKIVCTGY